MTAPTPLATITTADGWELRLRRLPAAHGADAPPVLLLHGFGANGYVLARETEPSLGASLAASGRGCWVLEQRGTRSSRHAKAGVAFGRITASDKLRYDLPAAIAHVLAHEGSPELDLVGHSLGGLLALAYLAGPEASQVRRCVTVASALRYRSPWSARLLALAARTAFGRAVLPARVPLSAITRLGAATGVVRPARGHFNLANVERETLFAVMRHGTEDVSLGELGELLGVTHDAARAPHDTLFDLGARLEQVRAPVLLIGGTADRHVGLDDLRETWRRLGPSRKRLLVVGRATGASADYGHTDLLLGPRAAHDVFPHVARWLDDPAPEA